MIQFQQNKIHIITNPQLVKTRVTDFHGVIPNVSTTKTRVRRVFNPYYAVDATQKKRVFTSVLRHVGFIMIQFGYFH
jgi:hypothetical protein